MKRILVTGALGLALIAGPALSASADPCQYKCLGEPGATIVWDGDGPNIAIWGTNGTSLVATVTFDEGWLSIWGTNGTSVEIDIRGIWGTNGTSIVVDLGGL